jgi:AAA+ ATPase superfamily predicted ATPase
MGKKFIDRFSEKEKLEKEYKKKGSSFVVLYGRRRLGKTTLIKEFIKDKNALFFMASEELESQNIDKLKELVADFCDNNMLRNAKITNWEDLFETFIKHDTKEKKILVIDEFQYLSKKNSAFPSIFQRIWDEYFENENVMLILCGSIINMMENQILNYGSPLYGRRTAQIKLKQIKFKYYSEFFIGLSDQELIELYSVTGGVPKYIELFDGNGNIYDMISENILNRESFLYEEPNFLLSKEVYEIGTYFSIIKTIAQGNHKLSKIASNLSISQSSISGYLKTLSDLDIIKREVPITEKNPEKSKKGLYIIKDNYIEFWFKFVYPYMSYIEMDKLKYVESKIKQNIIDNHISYVYEDIAQETLLEYATTEEIGFEILKIGKWWNSDTEIDIVAINDDTKDIIFGECKYTKNKVGVDVFYNLIEKSKKVDWNLKNRRAKYVIFSKNGFTDNLIDLSKENNNIMLFEVLTKI